MENKEQEMGKELRYDVSMSRFHKIFLYLSIIIALIVFSIQIANLVFVIVNPPPPRPIPHPQRNALANFIDSFAPMIVMITMSIIGIIVFTFLMQWKKNVAIYNNQKQAFQQMVGKPQTDKNNKKFIFIYLFYL